MKKQEQTSETKTTARRTLHIVREWSDSALTNMVCQWNFWTAAEAVEFAAKNDHRILTLKVVAR